MITLRVFVDGCRVDDFTVPWTTINDKAIERYTADYARRNSISRIGLEIVPVLDENSINPYNKRNPYE